MYRLFRFIHNAPQMTEIRILYNSSIDWNKAAKHNYTLTLTKAGNVNDIRYNLANGRQILLAIVYQLIHRYNL